LWACCGEERKEDGWADGLERRKGGLGFIYFLFFFNLLLIIFSNFQNYFKTSNPHNQTKAMHST
jgi:hypothetical protein